MITQIEEETGSLPPNLPRGVPPEVAQANPDVQAIIAPRLTMLMEIASSFLVTIIESLETVPYGIRWICKQIRSLTRRKYPDATDYAICSLIGGFFFLRFINPAIVTPQAYMLVDGLPSKHPRRTLTLVRKWHMAHGHMDTWIHGIYGSTIEQGAQVANSPSFFMLCLMV